jgi:hypothetical protein
MWFLLVVATAGSPTLTTYTSEQAACSALLSQPGAHVYRVTDTPKTTGCCKTNKEETVVISEGDCKPIQQFVTK